MSAPPATASRTAHAAAREKLTKSGTNVSLSQRPVPSLPGTHF
jgi:hypothetical protein